VCCDCRNIVMDLVEQWRLVCDLLGKPYLRDTLPVLASEEDSPGNATGVLALEEKRLRFAILEAENLAVATDVEFTLLKDECQPLYLPSIVYVPRQRGLARSLLLIRGLRRAASFAIPVVLVR